MSKRPRHGKLKAAELEGVRRTVTPRVDEPENADSKIFVSDEAGPEQYIGFFEDDGETGYLYVSDRQKKVIIQHLQIYTNSTELSIEEQNVLVVWSKDKSKCAVIILGGIRGIINVVKGTAGRAFMSTRSTPPIGDTGWLRGFASTLKHRPSRTQA